MDNILHKEDTISVLMAVHNDDRYLCDAIDSVLSQTFTDFDFVIVDDASTDRSASILSRYMVADPRIKLVRNEKNLGLTASLNRGLGLCTGRYIARMDSDDVCISSRLELQLHYMKANPDVVAVSCQAEVIDPLGVPIFQTQNPTAHDAIFEELFRANGGVMAHPGLLVSKEALDRIDGYDERFRTAQDLDLYLRLGMLGRLANVDDMLLRYRQHLGSTSLAKRAQQAETARMIVNEAYSRMNEDMPEDWEFVHEEEESVDARLRWGWNALRQGQRGSAARHTLRALASDPFNAQGYRLLACCLRGLIR